MKKISMKLKAASLAVAMGAIGLAAFTFTPAVRADNAGLDISEGFRFQEKGGEALYRAVCQSCHMDQGQGAKGSGMYPALAANPRLAAATYPVYNIIHGRKGMPPFGRMLSDEQIADVTNYVRTHMGNDYKDAVTPEMVKSVR